MMGSRYISILLTAAILLGPASVYAQGFDFGSDPAATDDTAASDGDDNAGNSGFVISAEEASSSGASASSEEITLQPGKIAVVALEGDNMSAALRAQIENKMMGVLTAMPGQIDPNTLVGKKKVIDENTYVGSETVFNSLQNRGMERCVLTGSICLNAVARESNVDALLLAYIQKDESGQKNLVIDHVDQRRGLTVNSEKQPIAVDKDVLDAIEPMLYNVFGVRKPPPAPKAPEKSIISPILAWSSLALSLGAAGAGGYFTYMAKKEDDALKKKIEKKSVTQVNANALNEAVKQKQTISFVFYGLAVGFAAASITFFVIDVGADVSEDQTYASIQNLKLTPVFSPDGAGFTAGFNF